MQPRNSSASALGLLCHSKSCCKQQIPASHHRYNTASCAPARRDVDRVFCPLARSSRRVASPGQYALSLWLFSCRCDSSFRDGRRPGRFVLRSPGSAFPARNRGFRARQGVTRWQLDLRGMRSGLYANPFPQRMLQTVIVQAYPLAAPAAPRAALFSRHAHSETALTGADIRP